LKELIKSITMSWLKWHACSLCSVAPCVLVANSRMIFYKLKKVFDNKL